MEIIITLLMFNCGLHLNQDWCVKQHVSCIETISSIKIGVEFGQFSHEQRLAVSYLYCVESGGEISDDLNVGDFVDALKKLNEYGRLSTWKKPGNLQFYKKYKNN